MQASWLVLASVSLGVVVGVLAVGVVVWARAAGKRRQEQLYPTLPAEVIRLLDELGSFAVILDASLSPVYANRHAREHETVSAERLSSPVFLAQARSVLSTGEPFTSDPDDGIGEPDPSTVWVRLFRLRPGFVVVLAHDRGEELRLNAMRRDFIANMSHELKTPISAISLLAEAVREAAEEPETVRSFSKGLVRECKRLANLTRDIIRLSEVQGVVSERNRERVNLRDLVRLEVNAYQTLANQHRVELVLTEPADTSRDASTLGRAEPLGLAISNLLSNAIKHSPEGARVGVGMSFTKDSLVLAVTDRGPGIAPEDQDRVFERFFRTDDARSREDGGTGLGLSIVRHTMLSHGGDVTLWSQPGVGSTFTLVFPLADALEAAEERYQAKRAKVQKKAMRRTGGISPVASRAIPDSTAQKEHNR